MTNGLDFNNEPSNQELLQIIQTMNVTIGKLYLWELEFYDPSHSNSPIYANGSEARD